MKPSSSERVCRQCGTPLPADSADPTCPACLLGSALEEDKLTVAGETMVVGPEAPPRPRGQPAMRRFGEYELLQEIARGGQGVVFRARQRSLNRLVALKMIALGAWAAEPHLKRFRTEAAAAANLDHPQIVPIYEIGELDGQHYFTMKLVDGVSLRQITADGPLAPRRAATIVAGVAKAIHYAHERGILHRDIKPGNILLDATDHGYVTDFGLAKLVEDESTVTNTMDVLGTPSYMSPEQAGGRTREIGRPADVYGLGAVLYELLTGNPPFAGGTTLETIRQVLEREPRPPRLWNPKVDRDLDTICLKCLEKEPARRYATAQQLAEDLERWLRFEPVLARPSGPLARGIKWARRNPARCALAGALALAALAGGLLVRERMKPRSPVATIPSVAVVLRAADLASGPVAKTRSRDLIHFLGKISGMRTLSKTDVAHWESSSESAEQIARATQASAVLMGELRDTPGAAAWNLALWSFAGPGKGGRWTQNLTNTPADWAALRSQLARQIVTQLGVQLSGTDQVRLQRPPSSDVEAHYQFVEGCRFLDVLDENSQYKALRSFESAVQRDPGFAQAYAMLGFAYLNLGFNFLEPSPWVSKCRTAINAAFAIDPQLPEAKVVDGVIKYFFEWDWDSAQRILTDAVRLDLTALEWNACYLHMLDVYGKPQEALAEVKRAVQRNPNSPALCEELACAAYYAHLYPEAAEHCRRNLARDPTTGFGQWQMARILAQLNRFDEALEHIEKGKANGGPDYFLGFDSELGYIRGKQGKKKEAEQALATLRERQSRQFVDPYLFAMVYAGTGDSNALFQSLNEAMDKRSGWMPSVNVEPKFEPFHADPRYQAVLARMKFPARDPRASRPDP